MIRLLNKTAPNEHDKKKQTKLFEKEPERQRGFLHNDFSYLPSDQYVSIVSFYQTKETSAYFGSPCLLDGELVSFSKFLSPVLYELQNSRHSGTTEL
ncbi:hypothetical protein [Cytobacillus firmus]|uniref:hypothetical protein n=1 Tax=Cytobacillus firmus TaxID=1399 RepID=UPI0021C6F084|nr:hypothetical protein [Cytobacillus firmus]